jgi:hypothetical protein
LGVLKQGADSDLWGREFENITEREVLYIVGLLNIGPIWVINEGR